MVSSPAARTKESLHRAALLRVVTALRVADVCEPVSCNDHAKRDDYVAHDLQPGPRRSCVRNSRHATSKGCARLRGIYSVLPAARLFTGYYPADQVREVSCPSAIGVHMGNKPGFYLRLTRKHPHYIAAVEALGQAVRDSGPLDSKSLHLVQLAAAAAIRSEGAVHSHVRRALEEGVTPDEIRHALISLTSTIGFPNVTAALSWCEDVFKAAKPKSAR
jgi:alkylhydroperoxidase/carboxymuconolactone decarboxylase family protein YurZ